MVFIKTWNINIQERMKELHVVGLSMVEIKNGLIDRTATFGYLDTETKSIVTPQTLFHACSISKFLTGQLVVTLAEQQYFHLDDHVNSRLVSYKIPTNSYTKEVTLRNLLNHQSGIIDAPGSFSELSSMDSAPTMRELLEGKSPYCNTPVTVQYEPESRFDYSDAGYCVIQQLIEDVMKKPFSEVVEEQIFKPLQMINSRYQVDQIDKNIASGHNKNGKVVIGKYPIYPYPAAAGLWTTPSDLAILVIELFNSLKGRSTIGISSKAAREIITPSDMIGWAGLGVFLESFEDGVEISSLGWGVGFQCMIVAFPNQESGLIIMTNTDLGVHQLKGLIGEIYHAYREGLL